MTGIGERPSSLSLPPARRREQTLSGAGPLPTAMMQPTLYSDEADQSVPTPWRPANEPPTEDGRYLIRYEWGPTVDHIVLSWYRDAGWTGTHWRIREGVTHWMPIPAVPKENEDG